jgi:hypothetical protein
MTADFFGTGTGFCERLDTAIFGDCRMTQTSTRGWAGRQIHTDLPPIMRLDAP